MTDIYKAPAAELQESKQVGDYGSLEGALAGDHKIAPIESLKAAWATLKGMKTTFLLACLVYIIVAVVIEFCLGFIFGYSAYGDDYNPMQIVATLISTFVLGPLAAGLYMIAIKHSVGSRIEVGEIFKHFDKIVPIFLTTVLLYILVGLGLILLVIPGIYLLVCFTFALILVVEKDMRPVEALKTSRKVVHQQWFQTAGLLLLTGLVAFLGALALLIGLIWAIPLASLTLALVYRDVFGVEEKTLNS